MIHSGNHQDRRNFMKTALFSAASLLFLPIFGRKAVNSAHAQAPAKTVSESDPLAVSLGYVAKAEKVDEKRFPKRAGAEGKKQFCDNCMFYAPVNGKEGKCQIFANNLVAAKGWCNTWAKKAT